MTRERGGRGTGGHGKGSGTPIFLKKEEAKRRKLCTWVRRTDNGLYFFRGSVLDKKEKKRSVTKMSRRLDLQSPAGREDG